MFDIGWGELVVIGIVALIAIGPKELPGVLRSLGQWMGKIRRMSAEFQGQFQEALREAEMSDLRKQAEDIKSSMTDFAKYDPLSTTDISSATASADAPPAPEAAPDADALPQPAELKIDVPLPDPPGPVSNDDFAPPTTPEPPPVKIAGSGS
jgi:sec-independent protein translocase protein TatB